MNEFNELIKKIREFSQLKVSFQMPQPILDLQHIMNQVNNIIPDYVKNLNKAITNAFKPLYEMQEKYKQHRISFEAFILNEWNKLEEEIKNQNRYFPKSEFVNFFEKSIIINEKLPLLKKSKLFRARVIEWNDFSSKVKDNITLFNEIKPKENKIYINDMIDPLSKISPEEWTAFIKENKIKDTKFWGYNQKGSDAPPENTIDGRVAPLGIRYLYTSCDTNTAIAEIQPSKGQLVSVAEIETKKELSLFSFDFEEIIFNTVLGDTSFSKFSEQFGKSFFDLGIFYKTVSDLFSKSVHNNNAYYYVTQYISEFIKHKGFDGIKYKSSLNDNGYNVVLFDVSKDNKKNPKNYKIINSSLHKIEKIEVMSTKFLPVNDT